jgi:hypothetical protein
MVRDYSPPESPLSSVDESDQYEEEGHDYDESTLRPSKRQRLEAGSTTSSAVVPDVEAEAVPEPDPLEGMSDVSSDTSGDIPSSPINARLDEEDFQEQVTKCDWDGCPAGDQGNMDKLVEHIHNSHIENRQKKYTCEWMSCTRKGLPHASGYALKAHMRSHTREKPFYCYLPGIITSTDFPLRDILNSLQNATGLSQEVMRWPNICVRFTRQKHSVHLTLFPSQCKLGHRARGAR